MSRSLAQTEAGEASEIVQSATGYPKLAGALRLVILAYLLSLVTGVTIRLMGLDTYFALSLTEVVVPTGLVAWYGWRRRSAPARDLVVVPRINLLAASALVLAVVGFWVLFHQGTTVLTLLLPIPEPLMDVLNRPVAESRVSLAVVVLLAAYAEEVLFRGVILAGLLENYSAGRAIFFSALLFAIFHVAPWHIVSAFAGGALLGWIYYRTRSVMLCAALHAIHNLFFEVFVSRVASVAGLEVATMNDSVDSLLPMWIVVFAVAVAASGFVLGNRYLRPACVYEAQR